MSTTVLLVRHGHTAAVGSHISGRLPGVGLSSIGREQAQRLVARLTDLNVTAVYSSPIQRAVETAEPFARARGLNVIECEGLIEIDFGEWTGLAFDVLDHLPAWRAFNAARGSAAIPGGESAAAVQQRSVTAVESLASRHPGATIAAFTHGDIIRSILLHYAGKPLDDIMDFEIAPASISALCFTPPAVRTLYVNA